MAPPTSRIWTGDNDGIHDLVEGSGLDPAVVDKNNDGVLDDNLGSDTDGDGIPDSLDSTPTVFGGIYQVPADSDGDGTPDFRDLDSDNDCIHDLVEGGVVDPTVVDANNDGVIDPTPLPDGDGDGIADIVDNNATSFGDPQTATAKDTDSDGTPDYLKDLDSDNDGIRPDRRWHSQSGSRRHQQRWCPRQPDCGRRW